MDLGVAVVGGGAAGLLAAAAAAARLRDSGRAESVAVLEAAREPGRKILVSGGGHCNVLPAREARARFVSSSPRRLVDRFLEASSSHRWAVGAAGEAAVGDPAAPGTGPNGRPRGGTWRWSTDALREAVAP